MEQPRIPCVPCGAGMSEQKTTPAPSLLAAAEALVHAYRARYAKRSTDGFRHNAPLYEEMVALNAAAIAFRVARPGPAHFDMSKVEGDGT
jgi:hypothetical protein